MTQNLPHCHACDLPINDGVHGMYCICSRLRAEDAKAAEKAALSGLTRRRRAGEKAAALAAFAADFDSQTRKLTNQ
jgi:hypothetical protein